MWGRGGQGGGQSEGEAGLLASAWGSQLNLRPSICLLRLEESREGNGAEARARQIQLTLSSPPHTHTHTAQSEARAPQMPSELRRRVCPAGCIPPQTLISSYLLMPAFSGCHQVPKSGLVCITLSLCPLPLPSAQGTASRPREDCRASLLQGNPSS